MCVHGRSFINLDLVFIQTLLKVHTLKHVAAQAKVQYFAAKETDEDTAAKEKQETNNHHKAVKAHQAAEDATLAATDVSPPTIYHPSPHLATSPSRYLATSSPSLHYSSWPHFVAPHHPRTGIRSS